MVVDNYIDRSSNLYILGDTHGDLKHVSELIMSTNNASLIHVGDFGHPHDGMADMNTLKRFDSLLSAAGSVLYLVRGNHDNPTYFPEWNHKMKNNLMFHYKSLRNFVFLRDYSIINLVCLRKKVLTVGGAISISRSKMMDSHWWKEERFRYNKPLLDNLLANHKNITNVVTHTAPAFSFPGLPGGNKPEVVDIIEERNQMDDLYKRVYACNRVSRWHHGHFHMKNTSIVNGYTVMVSTGYKDIIQQ